ncbi:aspartate kinase [Candidatus Xianfuyuplasma coldseepsis]|uniref:Homoserine dehydrogenase n=1 Tax=Candidatus Xianfuyuplasma coldseepsis TaxID=2782163 RepID=A0A7L7KQ93_9MOLU|nr:aspartate kinase [Xianfuyuplasma coldseepsis]QMS84376.1 aspartate kinase [Xianfuyuplasma coldseepsis]
MITIGLVGFGMVNSGVYEIVTMRKHHLDAVANDDVRITKILINNINKPRDPRVSKTLFTDDVDDFFTHDFDIIAEAITNTDQAYMIITRALSRGINVVTASKAVISKYYTELFTLAETNNCGLYVEATVAGGVPIIKPMLQVLQTNQITKINAILNGTTNYILSKMYTDRSSYKDALTLAQEIGYAEHDPTDDVEGYDALRKLVILSNLAYRTRIEEDDIPCRGISNITKEDMDYIKDLHLIPKLIGISLTTKDGITASVEPVLFSEQSIYNTVQLSNNIVSITGNHVGELQFYGPGAGKLSTGNSMVSDIVDILSGVQPIRLHQHQSMSYQSDDYVSGMYYCRFNLNNYQEDQILQKFDASGLTYDVVYRTNQLVIITDVVAASVMRDFMSVFHPKYAIYIRIEDGAYSHTFTSNPRNLIVMKFGGTSVGSLDNIKHVAQKIIDTKQQGNDVVVVVSAMGKRTDELVEMAQKISRIPQKREMDLLLATGEQMSISLLTMALQEAGEEAIALSSTQTGIITDDIYNDARIIKVNAKRLKQELANHKIVVIPGFQGLTTTLDITTLGRGGSDTTAVALSAVLRAERCDIYTDVEGVYTADPRIVSSAKRWDEISYDEMLELSHLGAGVMHPRSIELAKKYNVKLTIKSTFIEGPGTVIKEANMIEKVVVRGVTHDQDIVKVSIVEVPDKPGIAFHLFDLLAERNVSIDMIIQSIGRENVNDISFTVHAKDLDQTLDACQVYVKDIHTGKVAVDNNVVKLSIVGIGMAGGSKVASLFFKALYESGINIQMISTSEIKISCIVENKDVDVAINRIHEYFQLGEDVNID